MCAHKGYCQKWHVFKQFFISFRGSTKPPPHLPQLFETKMAKKNSLGPQMHLHSQGVPTPWDKVFV